VSERELREQAPEEPDEAAEGFDDEDIEEEDVAAGGELPGWLRVVGIVVVFAVLGPPIGGYSLLVIAFGFKAAANGIDWDRLSETFVGAMFFTAVFSYVFGGILAVLTGIMVAISRLVGGHTTILTPVFACVVANGAAALVNSMIETKSLQLSLPGKLPLTAGLLPASLFAAIVCWRLAKWWRLA